MTRQALSTVLGVTLTQLGWSWESSLWKNDGINVAVSVLRHGEELARPAHVGTSAQGAPKPQDQVVELQGLLFGVPWYSSCMTWHRGTVYLWSVHLGALYLVYTHTCIIHTHTGYMHTYACVYMYVCMYMCVCIYEYGHLYLVVYL